MVQLRGSLASAILLAMAITVAASPRSYHGYRLVNAVPRSAEDAAELRALATWTGVDMWSRRAAPGATVTFMVAPGAAQRRVLQRLEELGVPYSLGEHDVQSLVEREARDQTRSRALLRDDAGSSVRFDTYMRHGEIEQYLAELAAKYPKLVTLHSVGKSYEGRNMTAIRVSLDGGNAPRAILVDAGIHAREWIAPATALYLINRLVEHADEHQALLQGLDWYILPVVNPDGYEYTHTKVRTDITHHHYLVQTLFLTKYSRTNQIKSSRPNYFITTNKILVPRAKISSVLNLVIWTKRSSGCRFWRKNRGAKRETWLKWLWDLLCEPGADLNRNFGFHWMQSGASSYPCAETFAGKKAFSEVESQNLRDFVLNANKDKRFKMYLTLHSYGPMILYPWGYDYRVEPAPDAKQLADIGNEANAAMVKAGSEPFEVENSAELYPAAGGSDDWAKGEADIAKSYTIELHGGGSQGFDLPASRILTSVQQTFEGLKVFASHAREL
ncbi:zinc carboxypeptidase-like [Frankliniella occidentalis]|uniref:Zinc carboxypeptidase-like n=1 Tax=Frankliniella occidentalis TaxID=133901 RepID=A0A9C6TY90_FRAOC|nr:zinc carboxypeptidase-like [Frankliniella occidentalis]